MRRTEAERAGRALAVAGALAEAVEVPLGSGRGRPGFLSRTGAPPGGVSA